jgi:hypothetical protein
MACRKKERKLIGQAETLDCVLVGSLTHETIERFAAIFAEILKGV